MYKRCKVEGCTNESHLYGYCSKHYNEMLRYGHIMNNGFLDIDKDCRVSGCSKKLSSGDIVNHTIVAYLEKRAI